MTPEEFFRHKIEVKKDREKMIDLADKFINQTITEEELEFFRNNFTDFIEFPD